MKKILSLLALGFIAFAALPQAFADHPEMMQKEKMVAPVTAVVFFSENCGACKILDPNFKKAMTVINPDTVNVVMFDFSNADSIAKSKALAAEKNLTSLLDSYGAKTGFIVLLDHNGKEVDRLGSSDDSSAIAGKLAKAILAEPEMVENH